MRKQVGLALVLVLALAGTVSARSVPKVTGGGDCDTFDLAVNVIEDDRGVRGTIQYSRDGSNELYFHANVECSSISGDASTAFAVGPAKVQSGTQFEDGTWVGVAVKEGGTGAGDQVRVPVFSSEDDALQYCDDASESYFPATVIDGDFTIRDW